MATKVLLIDDDPGILDSVSLLLEEYGYEVETHSTGSILEHLNGTLPDVILLDIWLSGWDGKELCKRLKQSAKLKHIPVLLMSAHRDIQMVAEESGADGFVPKPFDIEVLTDHIDRVVG
jgi:DNA-binding response OmpR family regulator